MFVNDGYNSDSIPITFIFWFIVYLDSNPDSINKVKGIWESIGTQIYDYFHP